MRFDIDEVDDEQYGVMDYVKDGAKTVGKWTATLGYASLLYILTTTGMQGISQRYSERLPDKAAIEAYVEEECQELGIDEDIDVEIGEVDSPYSDETTSAAMMNEDEQYRIVINPKHMNKSIVRHEVYHIADGHLEASKELYEGSETETEYQIKHTLHYLLLAEPQASIYGSTGIEL